ncbi:hypothetical protein AO057_07200 [Curvibacter sp. PAE-UM]|nr:hypothetical protein AO057_07200 [Curvibacter sp. PAE-UM]
MIDLLQILDHIEQASVTSHDSTEPIDTKTLAGHMMMQMLGSFAEFERGVHCDRARTLTPEDEADLVRLWKQGIYTMDTLAKIFNIHPSSVKRAIYRVYKPGHSSLK